MAATNNKMAKFKQVFSEKTTGLTKFLETKNGRLILVFFIIVLINVLGSFAYLRLDITSNSMYSLSQESRETIKSIEEPLTVKVFFSDKLPAPYNNVQRYISDLITEYNNVAGSNFKSEFIDVESETGKAMASSFGITPIQVQEIASDQRSQRSAYMGLVIISGDIVEKMNIISMSEGLEYRLTSTIRKMIAKNSALMKLKEPVKVTLYLSSEIKKFRIQGFDKIEETVRTAAENVKKNNFGKVAYNAIDPNASKIVDEVAAKYNLQVLPWKNAVLPDGTRMTADKGVMAIVVENGTAYQVIRIELSESMFGLSITGLQNIEEKINTALNAVITRTTSIGYSTGHGEKALGDNREGAANFHKVLSEVYDVKEINLTKEDFPDGMRTFVINGPQGPFTDEEVFKIDQFMMRGGNVLFLIDSFNEVRNPNNQFMPPAYLPLETGLSKILSPLGLVINKDIVLDKNCYVAREGKDQPIYFYPILERKSINSKNITTKYINKLIHIKASTLSVDEKTIKDRGLTSTVLLSSSDQAWKMEGNNIMLDPRMLPQPPAEKDLAKYPLAVMVEGAFKSAFNGVRPPSVDPKTKAVQTSKAAVMMQPLAASSKKGVIVVTGTSEITSPIAFDPEGTSPDAVFIMNVIDYMNGTVLTQEMRSKGIAFNPLDTTKPLSRDIIKFGNMFGVPLIGVISGFVVWRMRLNRRKKIQNLFAKGGSHE